jgi:hypothetical protein
LEIIRIGVTHCYFKNVLITPQDSTKGPLKKYVTLFALHVATRIYCRSPETWFKPDLQDVVNEEAKGRGSMKVISNPFAGIAPIPINVPSDPLSGLMAMEAEELEMQMDGRVGVEPVCGERLPVNDVT